MDTLKKVKHKQKTSNTNKNAQKDTKIVDDRFKEVYTDPRFMEMPQKLKKIQIDDRFKSVLDDKKFNVVSKVDKYGRKVNKEDKSMKKFYQKKLEKAESE